METPQEWLQRLPLLSPPPNRIVVKIRGDANRSWRILRTLPLDTEAAAADPESVIDSLRRVIAEGVDVEAALLEAWSEGAKKRSDHCAWPTEELDGATVDARSSVVIRGLELQLEGMRLLCSMQRDYIRDLHHASARMHDHVPTFSKQVLEGTLDLVKRSEEDRARWQHLAIAMASHDGDADARGKIKALAREDLHHAGRSLISAVAARFGLGDAPLAGPMLDGLREFGSSLERSQLENLSAVLRPEQVAALLALLSAASGDPQALAPAPDRDPEDEPSAS